MCKLLKNSEETTKLDIFCFGLSLLEMISSDISGTHAFKVLCKIINKGGAMQVLSSIEDEQLRDMISRALEQEPDKRATLDELLAHSFLVKAENDHNPVPPCLQLTEVIKKYSSCKLLPDSDAM
jgi:serine/threonine protein kinase